MDGLYSGRYPYGHGDGEFLGTQRAAGDLPRTGHSSPISAGADGRRTDAGVEHPLKLFHGSSGGGSGNSGVPPSVSHAIVGKSLGHFHPGDNRVGNILSPG